MTLSLDKGDARLEQIKHWLTSDLHIKLFKIEVASADASFRRYFRLTTDAGSQIIMDAPPDKEDSRPFIKVARLIEAAGVQSPHIFNFDQPQGFMLLSDLGSCAYLDKLNSKSVDALYLEAIQSLVKMQAIQADLPRYNLSLLKTEMSLFENWYLETHLNIKLSSEDKSILHKTFEKLAQFALTQQKVFVHRDYHSRNLMFTASNNPGVIDFQDAVIGAPSYDLVSLIKDCYIAWPREKQLLWIEQYLNLSPLVLEKEKFIKQFDFMGMQRHLKAVGIFSRLKHRDAKPNYLNDIPRTLAYIEDVCLRYSELSDFSQLLAKFNITGHRETLDLIK